MGEYLLEHLAGISVEVEYASEFRYKKPVLFKDEDVVLVISQSGETADTLAAVRSSSVRARENITHTHFPYSELTHSYVLQHHNARTHRYAKQNDRAFLHSVL